MHRNLHGGFLFVAIFHYLLVFDVNFCLGQNVGNQNTGTHPVAKRQTLPNCTQYQHACKKGDKCIDRALLCDGVKDCSDASDETETLCKSIPCPSYSFQCNYGACIDSTAKCDGRVDCADNSDETDLECPPLISDAHVAKHCKSNQFQCVSGRCIDAHLTCNGKRDCDDGSDETIRHCENHVCPKTSFQCKYGACIDKKLKCDGVKNCPDGSDEFSHTCKETGTTTPRPTTPSPEPDSQTPGSCTLPHSTADKKFTVHCPDGTTCSHQAGKKVPKYTEVTFRCQSGYENEEGNTFQSICSNGAWIPPISKCSKICKTLKPQNVDLTCTRKGVEVDCNGVLLSGTSVRPRCKPQHNEEFLVYYREITCEPDGEWTNPLFKCVPECGKPYANVTKLIAFGEPEKYGDSPWQVAVYNVIDEGTPLICGGTIISSQLVVSAAHCFYDDNARKALPASDYEIVVSKVTRNYSIIDNGLTKRYKIRQMFFSDKGYFGTSNNYASDIVILWLAERITLSRAVLPACIKWTDRGPFNPGEGTPGKVVGWGLDDKGTVSEILLVANLPYISYKKCTDTANADFRDIITLDKFCAGTDKGSGVRQGDSGGGLLFRDPTSGLYYLRGIVSVKETTETSIAVFSDVTQYLDWIDTIRKQIENEAILAENRLGMKT